MSEFKEPTLWKHQQEGFDKAKGRDFFGFLFDVGCLIGDTQVWASRSGACRSFSIRGLYLIWKRGNFKTLKIRSYKHDCNGIGLNTVTGVWKTGTKECFKMTLEDGKEITATPDHKILTSAGWKELRDTLGLSVIIEIPKIRVGKKNYSITRVGKFHPHARLHLKMYTNKSTAHSKCIKVEAVGAKETYDITMLKPYDNYVANGMVVHNTGKTLCVIKVLRHKYTTHRRLLPTLIISPLITLPNWREEWLQFSKIPEDRILVLKGPVKKRMKVLEKALEKQKGLIVITNYDAFNPATGYGKFLQENLKPEIVICDESQKLKDRNGKRTKEIQKLAKRARYRYILTGTFISNSAFDVFSQMRFLDLGETFTNNFSIFRNKFFYDKNAGMPKDRYFPDWKLQPTGAKELGESLRTNCLRAKKEECIDLPELVTVKILVELTNEQKKHYLQMAKDFITYVEQEAVVAHLAITKTIRLRQIVSGHVKTDEGKIIYLKSNRPKALEDLLELYGPSNQIIVWAVYHADYKAIREVFEKLKMPVVEAHGLVKEKERFENIDNFKSDTSIKGLIAHPQSVGIGINLKNAGIDIRYSRDFSKENKEQSDARNYRGGSIDFHSKITKIDLCADGTIDEAMMLAVEGKALSSDEILDAVKKTLTETISKK